MSWKNVLKFLDETEMLSILRGYGTSQELADRVYNEKDGVPDSPLYMVKNSVWSDEAGLVDGSPSMLELEKTLGRKLTVDDFKPMFANVRALEYYNRLDEAKEMAHIISNAGEPHDRINAKRWLEE